MCKTFGITNDANNLVGAPDVDDGGEDDDSDHNAYGTYQQNEYGTDDHQHNEYNTDEE